MLPSISRKPSENHTVICHSSGTAQKGGQITRDSSSIVQHDADTYLLKTYRHDIYIYMFIYQYIYIVYVYKSKIYIYIIYQYRLPRYVSGGISYDIYVVDKLTLCM